MAAFVWKQIRKSRNIEWRDPYLKGNPWRLLWANYTKSQHTIDESLTAWAVKIVLDSEHLSEEDKFEAEKNGASVVLKKVSDKEDKKDGKDE